MFERFTDRARRVLVLAQHEARNLGLPYIDNDMILLGLAAEREGVGATALARCGITTDTLRAVIEARPITPETQRACSPTNIPFTARTKKALELSLREALQLGHTFIGTEHILLGLVRQNEGLDGLIPDLSTARRVVIDMLVEHADAARITALREGRFPERRTGRERRAGGDRRRQGHPQRGAGGAGGANGGVQATGTAGSYHRRL